ncbi:MAG: SH3 domain-containing protein [Chloroflexi bacterium]|nr:SH3 domain-containing protein [Chloroflexota bacterium]
MKLQLRLLLRVLLLSVLLLGLVGQSVLAGNTQQQVQFATPRLVVNTSFLNIRSGPGIQYSVLLTVVGGTELPVLARAEDNVWFQVSTVIGVGWVNIQYTLPRGSFETVPVVDTRTIGGITILPNMPATLGLVDGQGGGVGVPSLPVVAAASTAPTLGNFIRVTYDRGQRVTSVRPGERFRVVLNTEAMNLRTQPNIDAPALGTLFLDPSNDYTLVSSARDSRGVEWFEIDHPELGTGWVEAPKTRIRLSRLAGQVVVVSSANISLLDAPSGSGNNLPVLSSGEEGFLIGVNREGNFVQVELGGGLKGWLPIGAITHRTDTPTDKIDLAAIPSAPVVVVPPGTTPTTPTTAFPQSFGFDIPHIVINTGNLNIRSGPGAQYSVVVTVPGGTELPVLAMADDRVWFLVQGPFGRGWVNSEFTLFRGSIDVVPIIHDFVGTITAPVAIVAGSAVTLYAAPGTNFGTIGSLPGPIEVPVVARTADGQWLQLNTARGFGWVVASQVIVRGDLSLVPIVG